MEPADCEEEPLGVSPKLMRPGPKADGTPDQVAHAAKTAPARLGDHEKAAEPDTAVLLVEDNAINQRITSQQLRKAGGYVVHVADHGEECLGFLAQTTFCYKETKLSIILLDLEMPIMDGWTCARKIRELQRDGRIAGHVPIIAVTANARPEQISSAIEAGADAVVTKPFRIPDLIPRMREVMSEVASREQNG